MKRSFALAMNRRMGIFNKLIAAFDVGCDLVEEYDSLQHQYGDFVLYQAESHTIQLIGNFPGITVTALAQKMKKTPSACSQLVRRLRAKNWVIQKRNDKNNREYNLELTETGWDVFKKHDDFDKKCLGRTYSNLEEFTDEQLETYIQIQQRLNEAFQRDVEDSAKIY